MDLYKVTSGNVTNEIKATQKKLDLKQAAPEVTAPEQLKAQAESKKLTAEAIEAARAAAKASKPDLTVQRTQYRKEVNLLVGVSEKDGEVISQVPPEEVLRLKAKLKERSEAVRLGTIFEDKV